MRIGVAGLGVIGGSIGLSVLQKGVAEAVLGYDVDPAASREAAAAGCVTEVAPSIGALGQADMVFVAVPPQAVRQALETLGSSRDAETVVTDCTGAKSKVAEWAALQPERGTWFVGGHPMAGNEGTGVRCASAGMFEGAAWVLCPFGEAGRANLERVADVVRKLGANPVVMSAAEHDRHVAVLSHLPHAIASGLVAIGAELDRPDVAGGSWRDLTRVGGSNPALWQYLLLQNRDAVLKALGAFGSALSEFKTALERNDGEALRAYFEEARQIKKRQDGAR